MLNTNPKSKSEWIYTFEYAIKFLDDIYSSTDWIFFFLLWNGHINPGPIRSLKMPELSIISHCMGIITACTFLSTDALHNLSESSRCLFLCFFYDYKWEPNVSERVHTYSLRGAHLCANMMIIKCDNKTTKRMMLSSPIRLICSTLNYT